MARGTGAIVVGAMKAKIGLELGNKAEGDSEILGDVATRYSKEPKRRM